MSSNWANFQKQLTSLKSYSNSGYSVIAAFPEAVQQFLQSRQKSRTADYFIIFRCSKFFY